MLAPIYLGLCRAVEPDIGHRAASELIARNVGLAIFEEPERFITVVDPAPLAA